MYHNEVAHLFSVLGEQQTECLNPSCRSSSRTATATRVPSSEFRVQLLALLQLQTHTWQVLRGGVGDRGAGSGGLGGTGQEPAVCIMH